MYQIPCIWSILVKKASSALAKLETLIDDDHYDILPYATSENYDTIDDAVVVADLNVSFQTRQCPLPTPGYSGLMQVDFTTPEVYSRIDTYETTAEIVPESR